VRLSNRLKACGFGGDPEEFRRAILAEFKRLFPTDTDETVLCNPSTKAVPFCEAVCGRLQFRFPEQVVLSTLIKERKASQRR
jgi:hypothetical protein